MVPEPCPILWIECGRSLRNGPGLGRTPVKQGWRPVARLASFLLCPDTSRQGGPKEAVTLYSKGGLLSIVRTNNPTSVRHRDGLKYTSVCATPSNRLNFWDVASSLIIAAQKTYSDVSTYPMFFRHTHMMYWSYKYKHDMGTRIYRWMKLMCMH